MDDGDYVGAHSTRSLISDSDEDMESSAFSTAHRGPQPFPPSGRRSRRKSGALGRSRPRSIRTPSSSMTSPIHTTLPNQQIPSAPASPPTPAPSPSPQRRLADWSTADEDEEGFLREMRANFSTASRESRKRMLSELLNLCTSPDLLFVHDTVCPRLKRDPFTVLPDELSLRILSFVDHPKTLARSSQVSRRWHELVNDDMAWKSLCEKHAYRRMSHHSDGDPKPFRSVSLSVTSYPFPRQVIAIPGSSSLFRTASNSAPDLLMQQSLEGHSQSRGNKRPAAVHISYRSQFKRRYMVETNWRNGGEVHARQITPDQAVVTSLHLTEKYIVVALDNAKIHVFDVDGENQKTLHGHMMGVWAMVPWGDTLVSGGCDRDVRVWDLAEGTLRKVLHGHTSTVRCLRMSDANTAITGSRDTTLRVWDLTTGQSKHILVGHQASVRCVDVHGDLVASGSYDTTARIWSISEGRCIKTLHGHFSQIYAIAFDGRKVVTGSLDTSVRVWDPVDGKCLAALSGHTSLVGQLQMRGDTLVTGGSDGSVRVWSLADYKTIHRLAAHDNSVTSLQFSDSRIISGGSDGRVKVWDLKTGLLTRDLGEPADAVWRIVFQEEKAVVVANRGHKTIMEVWNFSPKGEPLLEDPSTSPQPSRYDPADIEMTDAEAHAAMGAASSKRRASLLYQPRTSR